jgi:hypothetical protein
LENRRLISSLFASIHPDFNFHEEMNEKTKEEKEEKIPTRAIDQPRAITRNCHKEERYTAHTRGICTVVK